MRQQTRVQPSKSLFAGISTGATGVKPGLYAPGRRHRGLAYAAALRAFVADARCVLAVAAPAASVAAASEPVAPAPQVEQAGESDQRLASVAVLGPLAIDGLAHKIKRAATYELPAYVAFHAQGASRDELTEASGRARIPSARPRLWPVRQRGPSATARYARRSERVGRALVPAAWLLGCFAIRAEPPTEAFGVVFGPAHRHRCRTSRQASADGSAPYRKGASRWTFVGRKGM